MLPTTNTRVSSDKAPRRLRLWQTLLRACSRACGIPKTSLAEAYAFPKHLMRITSTCQWCIFLGTSLLITALAIRFYAPPRLYHALLQPIAYVTRPLLEPDPVDAALPRLSYFGLSGMVLNENALTTSEAASLNNESRTAICKPYGWQPRPGGSTLASPSIVYVVLYNGELELLLLLLSTVCSGGALDALVVSEGPLTFSGVPKDMPFSRTLAEQPQLLEPWIREGRLIYVQSSAEMLSAAQAGGPFAVEGVQRDWALQSAVDKGVLKQGDFVLVGDVDEIPRPGSLWLLKVGKCIFVVVVQIQGTLRKHGLLDAALKSGGMRWPPHLP